MQLTLIAKVTSCNCKFIILNAHVVSTLISYKHSLKTCNQVLSTKQCYA